MRLKWDGARRSLGRRCDRARRASAGRVAFRAAAALPVTAPLQTFASFLTEFPSVKQCRSRPGRVSSCPPGHVLNSFGTGKDCQRQTLYFYLRFTIAEVFSPHRKRRRKTHLSTRRLSSFFFLFVLKRSCVFGVWIKGISPCTALYVTTQCFTLPAGCKGHTVCDCRTTRDVIHPSLDHYITGL